MAAVIRAASARVVALAFASCSSCATAPPYLAPSPEPAEFLLRVWEAGYSSVTSPIAPPIGLPTDIQPLEGARCHVWNDRGEWFVSPPLFLVVPNSANPLRIECSAPGYRQGHIEIACVPKGAKGTGEMIIGGGTALSLGLMTTIYTLAPAGAVLAGAAIAVTGHGIYTATAEDANVCRYLPRGDARVDLKLLKEGW